MTLRDILDMSIPTEPGYQAPRASRPVDDVPDYEDAPVRAGDPPPFRMMVLDAVKAERMATTERVRAIVAALPEAKVIGEVNDRRVLLALRNLQTKGKVRWLPRMAVWVEAKATDR